MHFHLTEEIYKFNIYSFSKKKTCWSLNFYSINIMSQCFVFWVQWEQAFTLAALAWDILGLSWQRSLLGYFMVMLPQRKLQLVLFLLWMKPLLKHDGKDLLRVITGHAPIEMWNKDWEAFGSYRCQKSFLCGLDEVLSGMIMFYLLKRFSQGKRTSSKIHVCLCMCLMYVCTHIYVCIYVCVCTHICMYVYIQLSHLMALTLCILRHKAGEGT